MKNNLALKGLKSATELGARRPHGTRMRYLSSCRCVPCRAANSRYSCERARAVRRGEGNPIVSANKARRHLLKLARHGIGRRLIADATGLPQSMLQKIKHGNKPNIRRRTEECILTVTLEIKADKTLLPAAPTWRLLEHLFAEGFTKARLAKLLGYKTPALQINRWVVTAKTALKVEKLYCFLLDQKLPKSRVKPIKQGYKSCQTNLSEAL